MDGDEILYIIARARLATLNGAVVGTKMSNLGLEHALQALNLDFYRSDVGDRYVMEMLQARKLKLGGESSGHIINLNLATTGDGIVTALQALEAMADANRTLNELKGAMSKYPQRLKNVRLMSRVDLSDYPQLGEVVQAAEHELGGRGRVLLRPSGTEPVIRVMVEGEDQAMVDALVKSLSSRVEEILHNPG